MIRRRRFVVDWRLQLKYAILVIIPILILGFFTLVVSFKVGEGMIQVQRQQLMTQIATLEESIKSIEKNTTDSIESRRVLQRIRNLKVFLQELIRINIYELRRLTKMLLVAAAVLILGSLLFGLLVSHRIAGPIYRLEMIINLIADGKKTSPVRTRATDEFKSLTAALEGLRLRLLESSTKRKELVLDLTRKTNDLKERYDRGDLNKGDIDKLITELTEWEKRCV
ncbi:MAG: methyl-accepting chemotaxis protein [Candidatus Omnitrophota bacterium]